MQLTEDHSLVNELVKSGEISEEMAVNHPRKNILTRSVGMPGTVEVDVSTHLWQLKDRLLLCSDGLTNMLSEEEIGTIIKQAARIISPFILSNIRRTVYDRVGQKIKWPLSNHWKYR